MLSSCPCVTKDIDLLKAIFIISLLDAFMHLSIASTIEMPEFIKVLNVSDIEANSDFKIRSPNKGIFNTKLSTNLLKIVQNSSKNHPEITQKSFENHPKIM